MLSLKLTLGALSAFAVAVVASVTLGIALTTSFAALRSLGTRHAEALMVVAELNTAWENNVLEKHLQNPEPH